MQPSKPTIKGIDQFTGEQCQAAIHALHLAVSHLGGEPPDEVYTTEGYNIWLRAVVRSIADALTETVEDTNIAENAIPVTRPTIDRILYNEAGDEIDEIVIHDCTVHVEQMSDECWWMGITKGEAQVHFNFYAVSKKRMTFKPYWDDGWKWDEDETHGVLHGK